MSESTAGIGLESVDLTDLDLFADGPPPELFARMRADAPVRWLGRVPPQAASRHAAGDD